jgi:hypothetical protein
MSWTDLPLNIDTLEYNIVNRVQENATILKDALVAAGYTVNYPTLYDAQLSTPIWRVRYVIQSTEDAIEAIEAVTPSVYFEGAKNFFDDGRFFLTAYQRWVLMLNDFYDIIINGKGQWGQMYLTAEDGNPDAYELASGNDFYIRGDVI